MKLLLFDIDGTILLTHGIGRRAVEASLSELSGRRIDATGISFSGKTDPQIIREVLAASGFNGASLNGLVEEGLEAYTELMRESKIGRASCRERGWVSGGEVCVERQ